MGAEAMQQSLPTSARRAPNSQRGTTLIEVLIAFLLLSIGLLGVAALHARALQYGVDGQDRTRAAMLANELVSSIWANRSNPPSSTVITAWQTKVSARR